MGTVEFLFCFLNMDINDAKVLEAEVIIDDWQSIEMVMDSQHGYQIDCLIICSAQRRLHSV